MSALLVGSAAMRASSIRIPSPRTSTKPRLPLAVRTAASTVTGWPPASPVRCIDSMSSLRVTVPTVRSTRYGKR